MAFITDLSEKEELIETDQVFMRSGSTDVRIELQLAGILTWGKQNGYTRLAAYSTGLSYTTTETYTTYNGKAYFPKSSTELPYVTTVADPSNDTNLTTLPYQNYKNTIDQVHDVGATLIRFDATDPNTLYPWQTWSLVTGDVSLRLGDGTDNTLNPTGNNTPTVPVPQHTHTATQTSHSHSRGTMEINGTWQSDNVGNSTNSNATLQTSGAVSGEYNGDNSGPDGVGNGAKMTLKASDGWTGNTSSTSPSITVANSGTSGATLNVRGSYVKINLWVRES